MPLPFDLSKFSNLVSEFISRPKGSEYLSVVDDAIRETREHLVDCMKKISGYPNVDTVTVKVWNNLTRPQGSQIDNDKLLLGYNSDINALEVITKGGTVANAVALLAYPVGSYYETSDEHFNPNEEWGGTWVQDSPGRVMVGAGRTSVSSHEFTVDETGGEEEHELVRNELPIHYHPHRHPHTHDVKGAFIVKQPVGTQTAPDGYISKTSGDATDIPVVVKTTEDISGETGLPAAQAYAYSKGKIQGTNEEIGWFSVASDYSEHGMVDADTLSDSEYDPQTHEPTRTITEDMLMHVGSSFIDPTPPNPVHNNLQPYKVCFRWHRTA